MGLFDIVKGIGDVVGSMTDIADSDALKNAGGMFTKGLKKAAYNLSRNAGSIAAGVGLAGMAANKMLSHGNQPPAIPGQQQPPQQFAAVPQQPGQFAPVPPHPQGQMPPRHPQQQAPKAGPPKPKEFSFYAMIENKQRGPYNEVQFRRLVENDLADADTLVWQEGMDDWEPAGEVKMMRKLFPKAAQQQQQPAATQMPQMPQSPQVAFYVNLNGQQVGPFNVQQLKHFTTTGEFTAQLYVWRDGMAQWELAGNVPELKQLFDN